MLIWHQKRDLCRVLATHCDLTSASCAVSLALASSSMAPVLGGVERGGESFLPLRLFVGFGFGLGLRRFTFQARVSGFYLAYRVPVSGLKSRSTSQQSKVECKSNSNQQQLGRKGPVEKNTLKKGTDITPDKAQFSKRYNVSSESRKHEIIAIKYFKHLRQRCRFSVTFCQCKAGSHSADPWDSESSCVFAKLEFVFNVSDPVFSGRVQVCEVTVFGVQQHLHLQHVFHTMIQAVCEGRFNTSRCCMWQTQTESSKLSCLR